MSTRGSIITELVDQLEDILITNGYNTGIGAKVYEWKQFEVSQNSLDCIIIRDTRCDIADPWEIDDNVQNKHWKSLNVDLILLTSGSTSADTLRLMIEDVYDAIGVDESLGGYAHSISLQGDETEIDQQSKIYGGTKISLKINYSVDKWKD